MTGPESNTGSRLVLTRFRGRTSSPCAKGRDGAAVQYGVDRSGNVGVGIERMRRSRSRADRLADTEAGKYAMRSGSDTARLHMIGGTRDQQPLGLPFGNLFGSAGRKMSEPD